MGEQVRGVDWQPTEGGDLIVVGDYKGNIYLFNSKL